jgi:peptidoglycan/LPS O-acetylase OafA/YrhL
MYAAAAWFWVFALLGLFLKHCSEPSRVRRYVADSSYWIYIVHLPLVCALQVAIAPLAWHWSLKFAFILIVSVPILFLTYHYLVRFTFVGATLNGRRASRSGSRRPA